MALPIPNEAEQPNPGPKDSNPIESRLIKMTAQEELQQELKSVRSSYQEWIEKGDQVVMRTQPRFAQIISLRSNPLRVAYSKHYTFCQSHIVS